MNLFLFVLIAAYSLVAAPTVHAREERGARSRAQNVLLLEEGGSLQGMFNDYGVQPKQGAWIDGGIAALEAFLAGRTAMLVWENGTKINAITALKIAGGLLVAVDGGMRFFMAVNGKDPTISPLLTVLLMEQGLIEPLDPKAPSERFRSPLLVHAFRKIGDLDPFQFGEYGCIDFTVGIVEGSAGAALASVSQKVRSALGRKVLQGAGVILDIDAGLRFFSAFCRGNSGNIDDIFPILEYPLAKLNTQPVLGSRNIFQVIQGSSHSAE